MHALHDIPGRRSAWWYRTSVVALAAAIGACSTMDAPTDPPVEPRADLVSNDIIATAAAVYSTEYSWSQGSPATNLGGATGVFGIPRVCYLTRVSGKFTGPGTWVGIWRMVFWFGGKVHYGDWYLSGGSNSSGIGARARCMLVADFSKEYVWQGGMSPVTITNTSPVVCFLTGVAGELAKYDEVSVTRGTNANWYLDGYESAGTSTALTARARCAHSLSGNNSDVKTGWWSAGGSSYTSLGSANGIACTFTRVGGGLQAAFSYVDIRLHASTWILTGNPLNSTGPQARAQCYA